MEGLAGVRMERARDHVWALGGTVLGPPQQQARAASRAGLARASTWGSVSAACTSVPRQPLPSPRGSVLGAQWLPTLPSAELVSPEGPQQQETERGAQEQELGVAWPKLPPHLLQMSGDSGRGTWQEGGKCGS